MSGCVCPNCGYDGVYWDFDRTDGLTIDCKKCGYRRRTEVIEEIMSKQHYEEWYGDCFTEEEIKNNSDEEWFNKEFEEYKKVLETLSDKPKTFESKSKKIDGVWYRYNVIDGKKTPLVKEVF